MVIGGSVVDSLEEEKINKERERYFLGELGGKDFWKGRENQREGGRVLEGA